MAMQSGREGTAGLKQRLEQILGLSSPRSGGSGQTRSGEEDGADGPSDNSRFFTEDVMKALGSGVPRAQRVRALKELHEIVLTKRLEKHAVEAIWQAVGDLTASHEPQEVRHAVLKFLSALIRGQYQTLGVLRGYFFEVVRSHQVPEDLMERLELLQVLTEGGRTVSYIESDIGPLMVQWMPGVMEGWSPESSKLFMTILVNLVHFNAVFLEDQCILELVRCCVTYLTAYKDPEIIELILDFLNALVCFGCLPSPALPLFITALCRTLNIERFCSRSWEVMRKLFGTHLGHCALDCLTKFIYDRNNQSDVLLLRGAVFYVSMSMWGPGKVDKLGNYFSSALPALLQAVLMHHTIVVYEVVLSMHRLVKKFGASLGPGEWDMVFSIVTHIDHHIRSQPSLQEGNTLKNTLDEIFSVVETLYQSGCVMGVANKFFDLLEESAAFRPVSSILSLIAYKSERITPDESQWIAQLNLLLEKFFHCKQEAAVRLMALQVLKEKLEKYLLLYEEILLHDVVIPTLQSISRDPESEVRKVAVETLVFIAERCSPHWITSLIDVINQVADLCVANDDHASLEYRTAGSGSGGLGGKQQDTKVALYGLVSLFKLKLGRLPPSIAVDIFDLLMAHLLSHYERHSFSEASSIVHLVIFELILKVRANESGHIGLEDGDRPIVYTPFIVCGPRPKEHRPAPPTAPPSAHKPLSGQRWGAVEVLRLDYSQSYDALLLCLQREPQWDVIQMVLMELPQWLENRPLLLSCRLDLNVLSRQLCSLVQQPEEMLKHVQSVAPTSLRTEVANLVYPALSKLCSYTHQLTRQSQELLIKAFAAGLISHQAKLCISSLAICTFEMQHTMLRQVATILQRLGQVSASVAMAVPVLEFLHGLCNLPQMCQGFAEKQYLAVFGIMLPCTDASRFTRFIVCLAHRVIALWFIRSRMQYRRTIAHFIIKSLMDDVNVLNLLQPAARGVGPAPNPVGEGDTVGDFHLEMVQLCLDVLARYTYSLVSTQPNRSPLAEFLVAQGPSQTWLLKNYLVTVTTSNPGEGSGTCYRCAVIKRGFLRDGQEVGPTSLGSGGQPLLCGCWSRGWAEVKIRRPTGCVSWLLRVQNQLDLLPSLDPRLTSHTWRDLGIATTNCPDLIFDCAHPVHETSVGRGEAVAVREAQEQTGQDKHHYPPHPGYPVATDVDQLPVQKVQLGVATDTSVDYGSEIEVGVETTTDTGAQAECILEREDRLLPVREEEELGAVGVGPGEVESLGHRSKPINMAPRHMSQSVGSGLTEFLPPLLSYQGNARSPSLHSDETLLNEQQQLNLVATMSEGHLSHSESIATRSLSSEENLVEDLLKEEDGEREDEQEQEGEEEECFPSHGREEDPVTPCPTCPEVEGIDSRGTTQKAAAQPRGGDTEDSQGKEETHQVLHHRLEAELRSMLEHQQAHSASGGSGSVHMGGSGSGVQDRELLNNPSFVFLQLYHSSVFGEELGGGAPPVLLGDGEAAERAIKVLDHIPPYDTHKIGVIYAARGQKTEQAILGNSHGSPRYVSFLHGLGHLVRLSDCDPDQVYLGGMDVAGGDGELACIWHDEITQVVFHVATLMPSKENEHSNKKLHIGNDCVVVVYNDSAEQYSFGTIKGQFNFYEVVIEPLPEGCNRVLIQTKQGVDKGIDQRSALVSDRWLPMYVRLLALHANMACLADGQVPGRGGPNWLERLHQINRIKSKFRTATPPPHGSDTLLAQSADFTLFCL